MPGLTTDQVLSSIDQWGDQAESVRAFLLEHGTALKDAEVDVWPLLWAECIVFGDDSLMVLLLNLMGHDHDEQTWVNLLLRNKAPTPDRVQTYLLQHIQQSWRLVGDHLRETRPKIWKRVARRCAGPMVREMCAGIWSFDVDTLKEALRLCPDGQVDSKVLNMSYAGETEPLPEQSWAALWAKCATQSSQLEKMTVVLDHIQAQGYRLDHSKRGTPSALEWLLRVYEQYPKQRMLFTSGGVFTPLPVSTLITLLMERDCPWAYLKNRVSESAWQYIQSFPRVRRQQLQGCVMRGGKQPDVEAERRF